MEIADLKGKRKMEDVYESQVEDNNQQYYQHEDAMMNMDWADNFDFDNQEVFTNEEMCEFVDEYIDLDLLANQDQWQCNDYNYQQLPADQDLQYLGDSHNNDVPAAQHRELPADQDLQYFGDSHNNDVPAAQLRELPADQDLQYIGDCHDNNVPALQLMELPPDFVFNPSDQELVSVYLKPKIENPEIQFAVMPCMPEMNVYEFPPQQLLENYQEKLGFFFTRRTKRYANGTKPKRTVGEHGHWRMTERTVPVMEGSKEVGKKSGLVFHTVARPGDTKRDTKTDWLMKEFHIPGSELTLCKIYLNKT